jgi:hypothetical protein
MEDTELERRLATAELERAQLDCQRLTIELNKLRSAAPWYQKPLQLLPMLTACISVLAFAFSVAVFAWTQYSQGKNAARQAEREFMKPWLESQWETYSDALDAASGAITATDPVEQAAAERKFWQLYYGRMVMVETKGVSAAMMEVGDCLRAKPTCEPGRERGRVLALASQMAKSMKETAQVSYDAYVDNQFEYARERAQGRSPAAN